jgi:hypothetical protein
MKIVELTCKHCNNIFHKEKRTFLDKKSANKYCSLKCSGLANRKRINVICVNCNKELAIHPSDKSKTGRNFCSRSCSATYNNKNKTHGNRRSKLEIWLESNLIKLYPDLEFHFNKKDAINSELDIFIPSLKLAFELNGIFHYEPIYGQEKLNQTQNNDHRKFQACTEKNISLCIIDTSSLNYFKEQHATRFLELIISHINLHLLN